MGLGTIITRAQCTMGMALHKDIHYQGKAQRRPCWAQGGLELTSRENATACVEAAQRRARQAWGEHRCQRQRA
eukprot:204798-Pyramimonas_sp.AAC.1